MTVDQRLMDPGAWTLQFRRDTPFYIRNKVVPYSHIVIMPGHVPSTTADASMLSGSRYVGMVRQIGPDYQVGGVGLAGWLDGSLLESVVNFVDTTLVGAVNAVRPASLGAGTVTDPSGGAAFIQGRWALITARAALDAIAANWGVEWKVDKDFTLDVGIPSVLYRGTPRAVFGPGLRGWSPPYQGIEAQVGWQVDYAEYASKVYVQSDFGVGAAGGASSSWNNGLGGDVTWVVMGQVAEAAEGDQSAYAADILDHVSYPTQAISISATGYDVPGKLSIGEPVAVYHPDIGLQDTTNQILFQGRSIYPLEKRVVAMSWPIQQGYGVYLRTYFGSASYIDLTPWIEWEDGETRIEVATPARSLSSSGVGSGTDSGAVNQLSAEWTAPTFAGTWTDFGPGYEEAAYRRVSDMVQLRGIVAGGTTGQTIFTLPAGFTPPVRVLFPSIAQDAFARVDVLANGQVQYNLGTASPTFVDLNGIMFSTR